MSAVSTSEVWSAACSSRYTSSTQPPDIITSETSGIMEERVDGTN